MMWHWIGLTVFSLTLLPQAWPWPRIGSPNGCAAA